MDTVVVSTPRQFARFDYHLPRLLRRLGRHRGALISAIVLAALTLIALFAPLVATYDPIVPDFQTRLAPPSAKQQAYVEAARCMGCSDLRIMALHLLPNIVGPLIVLATLGLGQTIVAAASLSFLGLGAQPPTPEWGAMLGDGRDYIFSA